MGGDSADVRVLVVDDDPPSLDATRAMLAHAGFEVRVAQNGAIGLEEVLTYRPDVVVFDFWMPVADGRELLSGIREVARGRLGLVAMSGTPEVEDWCARVGVRQFVRKPFEHRAIVEAVRRAAEESRFDSVRSRISSNMPTSHRLHLDRAVLVVGPREAVRAVRGQLRQGERPLQVAVVEGVDDAIRALASFQLDAIVVCGSGDDGHLPELVSEASVRGLPVVLDRPLPAEARTALPDGVYISSSTDAQRVVTLVHTVIAGPRAPRA